MATLCHLQLGNLHGPMLEVVVDVVGSQAQTLLVSVTQYIKAGYLISK
jgi:hypothetical protein